MTALILFQLVLGALALLIVGFVAFPYRGRAVPKAERLTGRLQDLADRLDPGEAPPLGVLSTPAKARAMSQRFEKAEATIKRGLRATVPAGRD